MSIQNNHLDNFGLGVSVKESHQMGEDGDMIVVLFGLRDLKK